MSNWPYEDPIEDEADAQQSVIDYLNSKVVFTPEMARAIDDIFNHLEATGH